MSSIISFFPNEFNKFVNTGARMHDSIYHMTQHRILFAIFEVVCISNPLVDYSFNA